VVRPSRLVDIIWGSIPGRIAALNLLAGERIGQFDEATLQASLIWWGEYSEQLSLDPTAVAVALGALVDLFEGKYPPGFSPPPTKLPDPHILDRDIAGLASSEHGASVRDALLVGRWGDTTELDDDGIDLAARPGTIAYRRLEAVADRTWTLTTRLGRTITNPARPVRAVMYYTKAAPLVAELDSVAFGERADLVRDRLGLVHYDKGDRLVLLTFDSALAEARPDRGRPTAVDAGGHARFVCDLSGNRGVDGWGQTADLAQFYGGHGICGGLTERVCGPFPRDARASVNMHLRVIGAVQLPRSDGPSHGDDNFANALERLYRTLAPGISPRDKILSLVS